MTSDGRAQFARSTLLLAGTPLTPLEFGMSASRESPRHPRVYVRQTMRGSVKGFHGDIGVRCEVLDGAQATYGMGKCRMLGSTGARVRRPAWA
jgi:hypothetical protein